MSSKVSENENKTALVEYKDNIFKRIIKSIKDFFIREKISKESNESNGKVKNKDSKELNDKFRKKIEFQSDNKELMAEKLRNGELLIQDLSEKEVKEMIEYFNEDIKNTNEQLERIKLRIMQMNGKINS